LSAAALGAIAWGVARAPEMLRAAMAALLAWLAGSVLRIRRAHVEAAMARAGIASPRDEAARMYRALGVGTVEVLALAGDDAARPRAELDAASRARWDDARRGGGVVLAASHTGNWEAAACALARDGEIVAVAKTQGVGAFDAFARRLRARRGVAAVAPRGALAHARAAIARGGVAAMMIDQVPDSARHAVRVDFLGAHAYADRAPAALAARTGAPLVVAASRRDAGRVTIEILDVLAPPKRAGRAWVERATRDATRALERFVLAHPREWLWLHRRWREPR
jgi:KDO2-lipid IV(A) lauroyltransferase